MKIEEHTHTNKGFQMFIAIMPGRVERPEFNRMREHAKSLGGWYSRQWLTTPGGFAFKDKADAERFVAVEGGGPADREQNNVAAYVAEGLGEELPR